MNNTAVLIFLFIIIIMLIIRRKKRRIAITARQLIGRKNYAQRCKMQNLLKALIGSKCLISTINDAQIQGIVSDVSDSGVVVIQKNNVKEIINLDFIVRVRELSKNK